MRMPPNFHPLPEPPQSLSFLSSLPDAPRTRKGELTRAAILEVALALSAREGIEGLTIGLLAERMHMSKSGVFAHFGSREDLQIAVVQAYHQHFVAEVFQPAMHHARGLPRLEALFANWVHRATLEISQGCIYIGGAAEYDDRPGPVRSALIELVGIWRGALLRASRQAVECGHLAPDTDPVQLVFEVCGLVLSLHHDARFLKIDGCTGRAHAGFARLVDSYRPSRVQPPAARH
jgi:AcrR family transcriptional regulator